MLNENKLKAKAEAELNASGTVFAHSSESEEIGKVATTPIEGR